MAWRLRWAFKEIRVDVLLGIGSWGYGSMLASELAEGFHVSFVAAELASYVLPCRHIKWQR